MNKMNGVFVIDNFISVIIFTLPGLLTYFWIQMLGVNPTVKHTPTEMVGISALLWVPTTFLTIIWYDVCYLIADVALKALQVDLSFLNMGLLVSIDTLNNLAGNLLFLFIYVIFSIYFSFVVARIWTGYLYQRTVNKINKLRIKREISALSEDTSVWDAFFFRIEKKEDKGDKGEKLIVEFYKIDKPEEKIVGSVTNMSRPFEPDRSLIIYDSKGWGKAHEDNQYPVKRTYVDTKTGIVINELNTENSEI